MSAEYQKFRQTRHFGSLDGLRALSILLVAWSHSWNGVPQNKWLQSIPILCKGYLGVDIFFAISGFLITTLLLREKEKYGDISLREFYIRRALRIWPAYYSILAFYVLITAATSRATEQGKLFFHYLPSYLSYTYNWVRPADNAVPFNFAWSLCAEEQFYLVWPMALKLLRRPWPVVMMVGILVIKLMADYGPLWHWYPAPWLVQRIISSIAAPICTGAILALLLHQPRTFAIAYKFLGQPSSALIILALAEISMAPFSDGGLLFTWITFPLLVGAVVVREDNGLAAILRPRAVVLIGTVSYGMYLYNTMAVHIVRGILSRSGIRHPLLAFPFIVGATFWIAYASFRLLESPFLKLKERFSRLRPASKQNPDQLNIAGNGAKSSVSGEIAGG